MTSPISREQLAQIREWAWVLPNEKIAIWPGVATPSGVWLV